MVILTLGPFFKIGPSLLNGFTLLFRVVDNCTKCYSTSYVSKGSEQMYVLNGGVQNFLVEEIEVYQILKS